jgi:excinuclease ABC subunit A
LQEVIITCHSASDVESAAFDAFLVKAVASHGRIGKNGPLVMASELS